ncbi:MAG: hypothetical protein ACI9K5_003337 [Gammaproteobacteria bacterium]|jgi:hypothetical protein
MKRAAPLYLIALLLPSACIVPPNAAPMIDLDMGGVSQHNFRGVPMDENGALQSTLSVSAPTVRKDGVLAMNIFANMALTDDNSGGALGSDNSREISRADYSLSYSEPLDDLDVVAGITHYTFPGNARGAMPGYGDYNSDYTSEGTTQLFGAASWDLWDLYPTVELFLDVDVASGVYLNTHIQRVFEWKEKTWFEARSNLAFAGADYAEAYYGKHETAVADFGLSGKMLHELNENTIVSASVNFSTLLNSGYSDSLDNAGIDTSNAWIGLSAHWVW